MRNRTALVIGICLAAWTCSGRFLSAESSGTVLKMFADPPKEYSTGPLWTWNDLLSEEQVLATLRDLAGKKVRQVWVHPQPGLMTPYLSDDWFRLWEATLREAEKLDMNVWLYDENSYPSGFAGGHVPEAMPESRGRGLLLRDGKPAGPIGKDVLALFRLTDDGTTNVTQDAQSGRPLPEGKYLTATIVRSQNSPWFADRCYVDLLYPGVTEKFLEITLEPYRRRFGREFGKHIPGVFTDEPSIHPTPGLPWTDDLAKVFQKRWGYSLLEHLPSLAKPVGDWRRIRHNYFQVLLDLYIERWAKPYYDYCQRNGLEFTGHYMEHEWPNLMRTPDYMALEAWQHRPGIDILLNRYEERPNAQLGNVRIVKEIGSVANQCGKRRTLSETYAGSGWEIRMEEMKRQGDWQYVLGLNTLNECLSHVTIRGIRKANWPRSLSYHNPWWEAYGMLEGYFTRLSAALSHGQQVNPVLVIEPTTTAWMYQGEKSLEHIGAQFQAMLHGLERDQVEYDLGSEDIIARNGSADGPWLVVGQRRYRIVVLAPFTENLNTRTTDLLESCLKAGATVLCCGDPPARTDGQPSPRGKAAASLPGWKKVDTAALSTELKAQADPGFAIHRNQGDTGLLFHHRRLFDDGQLLFLVNASMDRPSRGTIRSAAKGVQQWCLESGRVAPYPFTTTARGVEAPFELPPCGSLLLFLSMQPATPAPAPQTSETSLQATGPVKARRLDDNLLVIDYLDLTTGGKTEKGIHCRRAANQLFARNGMKENPWFNSVQFADEIIRRRFGPDSGFEATYRFTIAEQVPPQLHVVLERPDLYASITCNGTSVKPIAGAHWLDRSFGRIDIHSLARVGENTLTIKAPTFTVFHELEPLYVLGAFTLQPMQNGFALLPDKPLEPAKGWSKQGHPFYAVGVGYNQEFDVPQPKGRYWIELNSWLGSVAKVIVNGKPVGYIGWQPWRCEVTEPLQPGRNTVEVVVFGTLRNTLGPHHAGPPDGQITPNMWYQARPSGPPAGGQYNTVCYGLFKPFGLKNSQ